MHLGLAYGPLIIWILYLEAVNWDKVLQVHIAGHQVLANGIHHDTHDQAVTQDVWHLYQLAWQMGGRFPTLLEWDENIINDR